MHNKRLEEMILWYAGLIPLSPGLERIRKFFIWKMGAVCSECGWTGRNNFTGKYVIELDHIDGNRKNSDPHNFRLLCPNCHAMTATYKSLNRVSDKPNFGVCRLPVEDWHND